MLLMEFEICFILIFTDPEFRDLTFETEDIKAVEISSHMNMIFPKRSERFSTRCGFDCTCKWLQCQWARPRCRQWPKRHSCDMCPDRRHGPDSRDKWFHGGKIKTRWGFPPCTGATWWSRIRWSGSPFARSPCTSSSSGISGSDLANFHHFRLENTRCVCTKYWHSSSFWIERMTEDFQNKGLFARSFKKWWYPVERA